MGFERTTLEAIPKPLITAYLILLKMQIYPYSQKPQPNGRRTCFPSISMGRTNQNAYEASNPTQIRATQPQMPQNNRNKSRQ